MSLIETIRAKLVNYKADLVEFPYELANKGLIQLIEDAYVSADRRDYLISGSIIKINKHIIGVALDRDMHSAVGKDFIDVFIDFKNKMIAFSSVNTTNYSFDRVILPVLYDKEMYLARYIAKEVMPAILAMRLIS